MIDKSNSKSIGIIGGGAVGKAVAAYYGGVKIYDKYRPVDPISDVAETDYIFVAVPTPTDVASGHPDLSEMNDAINMLDKNLKRPAEQVVIIKSTVVPGTTDAYQKKYPNLNLVFNPEFLTERTAIEDFAHPDKQIVGFTAKTEALAPELMSFLPSAPFEKIMSANAAELVKYSVNAYYAFKVIFANTLYDLCRQAGADYEKVHEALVQDVRIIDSHFNVEHGGYRGYGGKCLPKDVRALAWYARTHGKPARLIESLITLNDKLLEHKSLIEAKEKVNV